MLRVSNIAITAAAVVVVKLCKTKLNASTPIEHPPSGDKMSKGLGGNIGCRDKTSSWYQTGSPIEPHRVNSIISGRSPSLYCTLTLIISMQGHQNPKPSYLSRSSGLQ